ncbi:MAG: MBL fold metallo-hydrolase [Opitutales bacterium]
MTPALEDHYEDVLSKACSGLGIGKRELTERTGLPGESVHAAFRGTFETRTAEAVAPVLGLDAASLSRLGEGTPHPEFAPPAGLRAFTTPHPVPGYEEMTVNAYLAWDTASKDAVVFDSGANASPMLDVISSEDLRVRAILLTHAHGDHIADLEKLGAQTGTPPVYIHANESAPGAQSIQGGWILDVGSLRITARETSGHSAGGTTYVVDGLEQPVAVVGDAIFASSVGGAGNAWTHALEAIRAQILSLPGDTLLCPGHGPLTTVAHEKAHNPFFPEFK